MWSAVVTTSGTFPHSDTLTEPSDGLTKSCRLHNERIVLQPRSSLCSLSYYYCLQQMLRNQVRLLLYSYIIALGCNTAKFQGQQQLQQIQKYVRVIFLNHFSPSGIHHSPNYSLHRLPGPASCKVSLLCS